MKALLIAIMLAVAFESATAQTPEQSDLALAAARLAAAASAAEGYG